MGTDSLFWGVVDNKIPICYNMGIVDNKEQTVKIRLLEFVKQAGISTTDHGRGPFIDDHVSLGDLEKFAELIVRECCQLIDDSTPVYSPENLQEDYCQGKLDGYQSALLEIREHFGLE